MIICFSIVFNVNEYKDHVYCLLLCCYTYTHNVPGDDSKDVKDGLYGWGVYIHTYIPFISLIHFITGFTCIHASIHA